VKLIPGSFSGGGGEAAQALNRITALSDIESEDKRDISIT